MRNFELKMLGYQRPVISLYGNPAIIDTGAVIPMTSLSPEILKLAWNAKLVLDNAIIGGIGGKATGKIYALQNFCIGDLVFDRIDMFVSDIPDTKYTFLLSATLFNGMKCSFNMIDKTNQFFTVAIPDNISNHRIFEVKSLQGELYAQIDGLLIQDEMKQERYVTNYKQVLNENALNNRCYVNNNEELER